ncbi:uncharacterized protein PV09_09727 [Verruconis gallopava]|uniref:ABC transporter domain-containing protein n=1 Tax=Verruconis gallopava TaxID=253628 RepID=A0A0D1YCR5_9PEZI|nr:uncharacterized protein PV09_09727 [Verruconis gallopava]KIV98461.1 hypothetical protein PV09_09727 [Verruconis gallopava]
MVYEIAPTHGSGIETSDSITRERQYKRLQEHGWFGYVKEFRIFLPCLWPSNIKGKLCLLILVLDLVIDRFLRVLIPQQIGLIMDQLIAHNFDTACYKAGIWVLLSWLRNNNGLLGVIKKKALLEVRDFSYQAVCCLAFKHFMTLSMDFHNNKESGEIIKAVEQGNAINRLAELFLLEIPPVAIDIIIAAWYTTSLFDWYVAFTIFVVGASYVWITIKLTDWTQMLRKTYSKAIRSESNTVNESLRNWQTVLYFNQVDFEKESYARAIQKTIHAKQAYLNRLNAGNAVQTLIDFLGLLGCSFLAIRKISSGDASIGSFVTLTTFWTTMVRPLDLIAWSYSNILSAFIDAERLFQLLCTKPSVQDDSSSYELKISSGKVNFRDVEFSYSPTNKKVINGISLEVAAGTTVAFVGKTGAGKSTILKLLCRFIDVTGGSISIDGHDLRKVTLKSLRDALGVVPQDPCLFNKTIFENVRYARPDATFEEVVAACKGAALHESIESRPGGYNTIVGERGVKLSGGEIQRVAIARLLLKNPRIIILDEATSGMDSLTETQVLEALRELRYGRTMFVVAHRLSTIIDSDLIFFIEDGKIAESGTHEGLVEKGGKYYDLWVLQNGRKKQ